MRLLLFCAVMLSGTISYAQTGRLVVTVKGINTTKGGELATALFTKDNFPKTGQQVKGIYSPVTADQMQVVFEQVPVGTYAVAVYQDIDSDHKLKTNLVGYPTEPLGFSRDARIRLGPPSFSDAALSIAADQTVTTTVTLR
ncbi:MAG: DUF2141 domain-containing protein [Bacteroidetes bacterium]|nr:DUF2141 domain-containing protein [Bacteroidota bacterium]